MEDLKSGIEHLRQAKAHMSKANGIMSNHISKLKELEEENAGLRAKLEAFIQSDDSYMRLPLDADGEPIRMGDVVNVDGDAMTVLGYRRHEDMLLLTAKDKTSGLFFSPEPSRVRHFKLEPPDSWEKLEEDANLSSRDYCEEHRLEECDYNMRVHLLARAKKLAGIEEEAQR